MHSLFIAVLFLCSLAADAAPLDDAQRAAEKEDYQTEVRILRPLAEKGDEDAIKRRSELEKEMSRHEVAQAQKMALQCQEKNFKGC